MGHIGDLKLNTAIIECIGNCNPGNEKETLVFIKKDMVKIADARNRILNEDKTKENIKSILKHFKKKKTLQMTKNT
ncbi:MAG: hypothetical protein PHY59_00695 [Methanobacterium sp.]|nr:hypothetical protein [Methanobacterium sp.]